MADYAKWIGLIVFVVGLVVIVDAIAAETGTEFLGLFKVNGSYSSFTSKEEYVAIVAIIGGALIVVGLGLMGKGPAKDILEMAGV